MSSVWSIVRPLATSPLPEGPAWQVWILERPWPTAILLALFGAIGWFLLSRRGQPRAALAVGATLLVAAAGVVVAGTLITTDRESVTTASKEFIEAALRADEPGVERVLDDAVGFSISGNRSPEISKDTLLRAIHAFSSDLEIRDHTITKIEAADLGRGVIRSQVSLFVSPKNWYPGTSVWRFDWRRGGRGAWRIESIDCLSLNGQPPGAQIAGEILRRGK